MMDKLRPAIPGNKTSKVRSGAALSVFAALLLSACAPANLKTVIEQREGVEISLREERKPPRPPPGPEFQDLNAVMVERSLRRVVVRYGQVIAFVRSDPVPLFTDEKVTALGEWLARELPNLPADKRIGLNFLDPYRNEVVDIELFPEGDYLVYEFRLLMVAADELQPRRGQRRRHMGIVYPQRVQVLEDDVYPILKDPIASAARPDFRLYEDGEQPPEEGSFE